MKPDDKAIELVFNALDQETLNMMSVKAAMAALSQDPLSSEVLENAEALTKYADAWSLGFRACEIYSNIESSFLQMLRTTVGETAARAALEKQKEKVICQVIDHLYTHIKKGTSTNE